MAMAQNELINKLQLIVFGEHCTASLALVYMVYT
jgi:hypothetical protein